LKKIRRLQAFYTTFNLIKQLFHNIFVDFDRTSSVEILMFTSLCLEHLSHLRRRKNTPADQPARLPLSPRSDALLRTALAGAWIARQSAVTREKTDAQPKSGLML
jgi:hypothetical protein